MTANLRQSDQIRQYQAKINEQCKNGSAQQAAPLAVPDPSKFPFDVLPLRAQEFITGAKIANGVPNEYLAALMLWTAATAAGNACKLMVKENSIFSPMLWLAIVGAPNSAKSPALDLALRPIKDADSVEHDRYKRDKNKFEGDKAAGENPTRPAQPDKVLLSDTTIEALFRIHDNRPRGIAIDRDELSGFMASFDRYSSGGELNMWLSLWSGMQVAVDRITSGAMLIKRPFVGVVGGIQPARLESLANGELASSGFLDRFLFTWPDDLEKPEWSLNGLDSTHTEHWSGAIGKVLGLSFEGETPGHVVTMTETARQKLLDHFNKKNKRRCDSAKNERLAGMYGKMDVHTIRLTLALHLLKFAYSDATLPGEIDADTVTDGIRLAEYFLTQSEKVHAQIFDTTAVDKLPRDVRQWYDRLVKSLNKDKETITTADAVTAGKVEGLSESKAKRFLARKDLFDKVKHGEYLPIL